MRQTQNQIHITMNADLLSSADLRLVARESKSYEKAESLRRDALGRNRDDISVHMATRPNTTIERLQDRGVNGCIDVYIYMYRCV
jgi:hypothetical protein